MIGCFDLCFRRGLISRKSISGILDKPRGSVVIASESGRESGKETTGGVRKAGE